MRIAFLVFIVTFIFVLTARRLRPTVTTCEHGIVPTGWCEDCEMGILRTWPERGAEGIGKREIKMTNPMSDARLEEIEMRGKLAKELYAALSFLGADHQLLGAVSSWGDGEDETTILGYLQSWNRATRRQLAASLPATSPDPIVAQAKAQADEFIAAHPEVPVVDVPPVGDETSPETCPKCGGTREEANCVHQPFGFGDAFTCRRPMSDHSGNTDSFEECSDPFHSRERR